MATKKKISPVEILTPIKPDEYKPVFKTVEFIYPQKIDLNWISIRRKIQRINFFKWLSPGSLSSKLKLDVKEKVKTKLEFNLFSKLKSESKSVWDGYCFYFNLAVNNKINLPDEDEDYNKLEEQIRGKK